MLRTFGYKKFKNDNSPLPDGHPVFVIRSPLMKKENIERWVNKVVKDSKQVVGCHYEGGRAHIIGWGNLDAIRYSIKKFLPELNEEIYSFLKSKFNRCPQLFDPSFIFNPYTAEDIDAWKEKENTLSYQLRC